MMLLKWERRMEGECTEGSPSLLHDVVIMIIRNKTIYFKSGDSFFGKEQNGKKPNTVRFFNDPNEEFEMNRFYEQNLKEQKYIEIQHADEPLVSFKRDITDISFFVVSPGITCWIISWDGNVGEGT